MSRKYMPWLREVTHAGITAENLAVPLRGQTAPLPEESSEICFLALGTSAQDMRRHLEGQRSSLLWERRWICDPENPDAIKVIAFAYRSVATSAMSIYAAFGVPTVEVTKEELSLLVEDCHQILLAAEDADPILLVVGLRLGLIQKWLRQHRHDEIVECLKAPQSAQEACWLLNARDKLSGRKVVADVEELPWSVRVKEWDILPCKAIHRDGNAIYFEGEWKFMPLEPFWHRYGNPSMTPQSDLPYFWRIQLRLANRLGEEEVELTDEEDLSVFIYDDGDGPAS